MWNIFILRRYLISLKWQVESSCGSWSTSLLLLWLSWSSSCRVHLCNQRRRRRRRSYELMSCLSWSQPSQNKNTKTEGEKKKAEPEEFSLFLFSFLASLYTWFFIFVLWLCVCGCACVCSHPLGLLPLLSPAESAFMEIPLHRLASTRTVWGNSLTRCQHSSSLNFYLFVLHVWKYRQSRHFSFTRSTLCLFLYGQIYSRALCTKLLICRNYLEVNKEYNWVLALRNL